MGNISIREVAEACGVSVGTVSKALNHSDRVGSETAERIRATAAEMGYVGSDAARALSARRRRVVLWLTGNGGWEEERLQKRAADVFPTLTAFGMEAEICLGEAALAAYRQEGEPDLLIATSFYANRLAGNADLPVVLLHARSSLIPTVAEAVPEYRVAGRLAAQFSAFATAGGDAAILIARRGTYAGEEMIRGFREIVTRLMIPFAGIAECGDSAKQVAAELRHLCAASPRLRTLFVPSALIPAVLAAAAEMKKKFTVIGSDFSASSVDALRGGQIAALLYTAPERQLDEAVRAAHAYLFGSESRGLIAIRPELVLRSNLECYLS